jgi:prolycopene isomerase
MIEESDAGTPLTNIRFTGNCGGAIYGYEQAMNNTFINRIDNRTPISNLYLASAWSSPGGGFTGAMRSGQKAWRAIVKDFN